jgi:hypothetical protein
MVGLGKETVEGLGMGKKKKRRRGRGMHSTFGETRGALFDSLDILHILHSVLFAILHFQLGAAIGFLQVHM